MSDRDSDLCVYFLLTQLIPIHLTPKSPNMKPLKCSDNRRAAVLIARLLQGKIRAREEVELDRWIREKDNYKLFEALTHPDNRQAAAEWLAANGVNPRFLKKKPFEYYQPTYDPLEMRTFWIGMAVGFLGLIVVYFVLRIL